MIATTNMHINNENEQINHFIVEMQNLKQSEDLSNVFQRWNVQQGKRLRKMKCIFLKDIVVKTYQNCVQKIGLNVSKNQANLEEPADTNNKKELCEKVKVNLKWKFVNVMALTPISLEFRNTWKCCMLLL